MLASALLFSSLLLLLLLWLLLLLLLLQLQQRRRQRRAKMTPPWQLPRQRPERETLPIQNRRVWETPAAALGRGRLGS